MLFRSKVFVDGNWIDTDLQWAKDNHYKSALISDLPNAGALFEKIEQNAKVIDKLRDMGFPIDYQPLDQNCNTWSKYIADLYLNGFDIFDLLNEGVIPPDTYRGSEDPFPYLPLGEDAIAIKLLEDILEFLNLYDLSLNDVNIILERNIFSTKLIIKNNEYYYESILEYSHLMMYRSISDIKDLFGEAEETRSPLVIDLDGDGIETLTAAGGVYFDHDGNGFRENSGWVGQDDGLLVRDINGNGQIDDGSELFGNHTLLSNGEKAANGFEALKDLDSNGDGVFNASDEAWNQIMIWQDRNSNGKVDSGELLTLESAGIAGIDLDYEHQEVVDANGNAHKQSGTIIKSDGTTGSIADVWFDTNPEATIDDLQTEIPEAVLALPNISGSGNVHNLHTAMALA